LAVTNILGQHVPLTCWCPLIKVQDIIILKAMIIKHTARKTSYIISLLTSHLTLCSLSYQQHH
jgi:hypothetical protein